MDESKTAIVELKPMRIVSFRAFGDSPEEVALQKLMAWAKPKGWLEDTANHRVYGFDNPPPSEDRKEYGYEVWIQVEPEIHLESNLEIKQFNGGLYAVTTCAVRADPWKTIPAAWQRLAERVQTSEYEMGPHQHLEKYRNPGASLADLVLDLHCPIQKRQ